MLTKPKPVNNNNNMFEIRVAVIGYVSVGKTTLINALFGDEYGEVAMKRTTAVVNAFRISNTSPLDDSSLNSNNEEKESDSPEAGPDVQVNDVDDEDEDSSMAFITPTTSPDIILEESKADNKNFRKSNKVKERSFDIVLESPLHKMRSDTQLVIVDVPGINEAGTSSKYKDYVNEHWHTFDIVVLVMDGRQGVNTEEQLNLLQLANNNLEKSKAVPLILVANKVDDPENEEQKALLNEARDAVSTVFGVGDREPALKAIFKHSTLKAFDQASVPWDDVFPVVQKAASKKSKNRAKGDLFPLVVPISAMHAFVYRCGARLSYDEFCQMDSDFIDKIGKDSYGRQWHRFDKQKRLQKAFASVSEEEQRDDGLEASNFDTFMKALSFCIGDEDHQTTLIEKQIDVALHRMNEAKPNSDLGAELLVVFKHLTVLKKSTDHLPGAFWSSFRGLNLKAFEDFGNDFVVKSFANLMDQLFNYMKALKVLPWPDEKDKVVRKAKELALQYALGVIGSDQFKAKDSDDQAMVIRSMLLAASETFNMHFGTLKIYLESKYKFEDKEKMSCCSECKTTMNGAGAYGERTNRCRPCRRVYVPRDVTTCPNCASNGSGRVQPLNWTTNAADGEISSTCRQGSCRLRFYPLKGRLPEMKVTNGKLVPVDEAAYKELVSITVPESLQDPSHFGYLLWKCCQLLKETESNGPDFA